MGLSIAAYAKHRGCSRKAVQKAIDAGRIRLLKDGTINAKKADQDWEANTSPGHARSGAAAAEAAKGKTADGSRKTSAETATSLAMKRRHDAAKARLAEIELAEREGALTDAAKADAMLFNKAREFRDALVNWPPRIAAEFAAELGADPRRMLSLLEKHVDRLLAELSSRDATRSAPAVN